MPEQTGEKSEEATQHRRERARTEGQVAKSQDLSSALLLLGAVGCLMYLGSSVVDFMGMLASRKLGGEQPWKLDQAGAVFELNWLAMEVGNILLPLFGLMMLVGIATNVGQIGFHFLPQKLALDINRINPLRGLKRIFSAGGFARLAFGVFKVMIVTAVSVWSLWGNHEEILLLGTRSVPEIAGFVPQIVLGTCLKIGWALLILALFDYFFQRWKYEQDIRMTTQEVREEVKSLQGDPQIVARRRAVQRQLVLNRLNTSVLKADVVVTNPTQLAIAIQYDPITMPAPVVLAKGAGVLADRIRKLALEHGIPVVERKPLAQALYQQAEPGETIPAEQYMAVAEVLKYVYRLQGKTLSGMQEAA